MDYHDRITIRAGVRSGKPCIRGMRISVSDVLQYLASGMTEEEILTDFPELEKEDIEAVLAFAADRMTVEQVKSEALKLPQDERAQLAQELIESLDVESEIARAWYAEAEARLLEIKEGTVEAIPADEVFASAREMLKGRK